MDEIRSAFARAGLVRPYAGRLLAGVCAGVAVRAGVPAWIVRLVLVLLLVLPGSPFLIYAVLWFCMPSQGWVPGVRTTP
ncbi:PspC domain-containing protein [Cellulomonas shaoxiangyii]|uniref:PspC domain-containing protein n=1 Tax=Cellulomonas shaoxiangyii TaxID=2566013 RepID=A0A4P7SK39_9CELL|nr:PspC domain-containing protein [Cellulomonas shaoxiangyii]QCB94649.1 PspC domain-containing protein [Cellulomonas shaoxiangyii]TGY77595.1 PspC domain-containing protein [Cellulomonas shaoxiangyii]